jgi:hypothetical protein
MADFSKTSDDELRVRLDALLKRLDYNLKYVAPMLKKISDDRFEAATVVEEMKKRGIDLDPGKDATSTTV